MTNSPAPPAPQTNPNVIDNARLNAPAAMAGGDFDVTVSDLYNQLGELSDALAESEAEIERLKGAQNVESVKAKLLEPYVKGVFRFVVGYCATVGALLLLAGFSFYGFALPETILGIIAGSTAVSVIGLIGLVISGLFGKSGR